MIKQPTKNTCGQTCIAWYLNIPVSEVIAAMGDRKTYPRDLRKYLETHGVGKWSNGTAVSSTTIP